MNYQLRPYQPPPSLEVESLAQIEGLGYYPDYLTAYEQEKLLEIIDHQPWLSDLKRRVQHYGYKYDYKERTIRRDMYLGPLPDWCLYLAKRFKTYGWFQEVPDQVIVNEYQPGQGITGHVDCVDCFSETLVSISLASTVVMEFFPARDRKNKIEHPLEPGSLLLLKGPARYQWCHGIMARKSDQVEGEKVPRQRRVSLTFRKVILASGRNPHKFL